MSAVNGFGYAQRSGAFARRPALSAKWERSMRLFTRGTLEVYGPEA